MVRSNDNRTEFERKVDEMYAAVTRSLTEKREARTAPPIDDRAYYVSVVHDAEPKRR